MANRVVVKHGMTVSEFTAAYEAGLLSLTGDFSVALPDQPWVTLDPRSAAYRDWVLASWREISGRSGYEAVVDEVFDASAAAFLPRPYPFNTGDGAAVGNYTGAIAWLLRTIRPHSGQRIVELGSGWGLLAINLAMLGCETTAVDLNPSSVDLLRARADGWNVDLNVVRAPFLEFEPHGLYDLVVYFEAFHHCDQPFELLDRSVSMLTPGGSLLFLADAIYDDFYCPWGVRLDCSATYMTRYAGWLELGFERQFFYNELQARGLHVTTHTEPSLGPYGHLVVATRDTTAAPTTSPRPGLRERLRRHPRAGA